MQIRGTISSQIIQLKCVMFIKVIKNLPTIITNYTLIYYRDNKIMGSTNARIVWQEGEKSSNVTSTGE